LKTSLFLSSLPRYESQVEQRNAAFLSQERDTAHPHSKVVLHEDDRADGRAPLLENETQADVDSVTSPAGAGAAAAAATAGEIEGFPSEALVDSSIHCKMKTV
jgi:hypothetical protein